MSYPMPLARYDQVILAEIGVGVSRDPGDLVGGDTERWEILGVTANEDSSAVLLGRVRERRSSEHPRAARLVPAPPSS